MPSPSVTIAPIWQDTYYSATTDSFRYTIDIDRRVIFSGKAVKMPDENVLRININRIAENYLEQDIDKFVGSGTTSNTTVNNDACLGFALRDSGGTLLVTYYFLYDWDYGHSFSAFPSSTVTLTENINGHYTDGQMKLKTTINSNGTVNTVRNDTVLYTKEVCADYVLHYVGTKGWHSFPFEGNCTKQDSLTHHYFNRNYDNTTRQFETGKYLTEISTVYKLNTGILTEEEAAVFAKNLISSPKAYLQIISEGKIIPVVITDTTAQYKTDNQNEIITYEVTVKESQSKIKR